MPKQSRLNLRNQLRHHGTCMFYNLDNDRCGIYSARPSVCQAFGRHKNLVCFRNPDAATGGEWSLPAKPIGLLTVDITWMGLE